MTVPSAMAWRHFGFSEPVWQQPGKIFKKQQPHPRLPGHGYVRKTWISGNDAVVYRSQTWESLQGWAETDRSYLENTKSSLAKIQTLEGPDKRFPREEEAVIKPLTAPSPEEKWLCRIPIKDIWNHSSYLSPPSPFLSRGPAAQLFPPVYPGWRRTVSTQVKSGQRAGIRLLHPADEKTAASKAGFASSPKKIHAQQQ